MFFSLSCDDFWEVFAIPSIDVFKFSWIMWIMIKIFSKNLKKCWKKWNSTQRYQKKKVNLDTSHHSSYWIDVRRELYVDNKIDFRSIAKFIVCTWEEWRISTIFRVTNWFLQKSFNSFRVMWVMLIRRRFFLELFHHPRSYIEWEIKNHTIYVV